MPYQDISFFNFSKSSCAKFVLSVLILSTLKITLLRRDTGAGDPSGSVIDTDTDDNFVGLVIVNDISVSGDI